MRLINWSPLHPGLEEIYIQDMHYEIMTPGPWIWPLVTKLHLTSHATSRFNNQAWIKLPIHTSNIQPMTAGPRFQVVNYYTLHEYLIVFPSLIECLHSNIMISWQCTPEYHDLLSIHWPPCMSHIKYLYEDVILQWFNNKSKAIFVHLSTPMYVVRTPSSLNFI